MFFDDKTTLRRVHKQIAVLSDAKDFLGVNKERKMLVLKWLNVFGYAERKLLIELANIDNSGSGGYRFIANLVKQDYIQPFKNEYYGKEVFMLDKRGLGELINEQIIGCDAKLPNKKKFIRSSRLVHDIGMQYAVLSELLIQNNKTKLIGIEKDFKCNNLMIDTMLTVGLFNSKKRMFKAKFAVEYERTEKSRRRIEYLLVEHIENIKKREYGVVTFYFNDLTKCKYYIKILIDKPRVWHKNKDGNLIQIGDQKYAISDEIAEKVFFKCVDATDSKNELFSSSLANVRAEKEPTMQAYVQDKRQAIQKKKDKRQELTEQIEEQLRPKIEQEITPRIKKQAQKELLEQLLYQFDELGAFSKGQFRKYLTGEWGLD